MITITGGNFQDLGGNLLTGTLTLVLSQDANTSGSPPEYVYGGVSLTFAVTSGELAVSEQIWSNAEFDQSGTYYTATLQAASGQQMFKKPQTWVFVATAGQSVNLNTMSDTSI